MYRKAELVDAVAEKLGIAKAEAQRTVEAVLDCVMEAVANGERVQLTGFGTFDVRSRRARTGRNPKTGETIDIAASTTVGFKPGKAFKDLV